MYFSAHNHTEYSNLRLLDSINRIPDLFNRAIDIGLKGFAITDHESLSSHVQAVQHYNKLLKEEKINKDFKLVLGDEIYLIEDLNDYKENYTSKTHWYYHFILLAKDRIGYDALKEISSTAWANSFTQKGVQRTPITKDQLSFIMRKYKGHIIASTACLGGELPKKILELEAAERSEDPNWIYNTKLSIHTFIHYCINTFGIENFFCEIQPSIITKEQILVNLKIIKIAEAYNIKIIYTTDSHYLSEKERIIHKTYLNAMEGEREVDAFYASAYMMDIEDLKKHFNYLTQEQIDEFTQNTLDLMNMCEMYDLYQPQFIPNVEVKDYDFSTFSFLDDFPYLDKMLNSIHKQDRYWINECLNTLNKKKLNNEKYLARLNEEAKELWEISENLGVRMTSYYNTMKQIIEIVWDKGDSIVGVARGSATGFLSCYLLGITQLDPLQWNLPHWRLVKITSLYSNI